MVYCSHLSLFASGDFVSTMDVKGKQVLLVKPEALTLLAQQAFVDVAHLLRPDHLKVRCICNNLSFLSRFGTFGATVGSLCLPQLLGLPLKVLAVL